MAVNYSKTKVGDDYLHNSVSWTVGQNDEGVPHSDLNFADASVHISGTFGGASASFQGSNTNLTFVPLNDGLGGLISAITSEKLKQVYEGVLFTKPVVTGGDGTTAIKFTLVARKAAR